MVEISWDHHNVKDHRVPEGAEEQFADLEADLKNGMTLNKMAGLPLPVLKNPSGYLSEHDRRIEQMDAKNMEGQLEDLKELNFFIKTLTEQKNLEKNVSVAEIIRLCLADKDYKDYANFMDSFIQTEHLNYNMTILGFVKYTEKRIVKLRQRLNHP